MPGNPAAKLKRIDNLVEWFTEFAVDFDKLLPACYRYDGQPPGRDRRANAWAAADKAIITAADALGELQTVLRSRVVVSTVNRGGSKGYTVRSAG